MRYCAHCGHIIDEYDLHRDDFNCSICDAILLEDDMTALKYAELSEQEKDEYEQQLLNTIKNSVGFGEDCFQRNCSMDNGTFWRGFRPDKYIRVHKFKKEEYKKNYIKFRKANEPFKPFPPIDKEKSRQHTHDSVEMMNRIKGKNSSSNNIPKCPTCNSTDITCISATAKVVNTAMFGIFGQKRKRQFKCNNCKYEW